MNNVTIKTAIGERTFALVELEEMPPSIYRVYAKLSKLVPQDKTEMPHDTDSAAVKEAKETKWRTRQAEYFFDSPDLVNDCMRGSLIGDHTGIDWFQMCGMKTIADTFLRVMNAIILNEAAAPKTVGAKLASKKKKS